MYTVIKLFKDKYNGHIYRPGDSFESEDKNRVNDLIKRGLIEGAEVPSLDSLSKKELMKLLEEKKIEFDPKQTKAELKQLLQGGG